MSFLFQSLLTIGLPLIALPLVIHLINLRRHRRIEWAAMEFLLESQKRNKKWILLRQFLLLLLRTAAIALAVLMLAGPVLMSQWGSLFGSGSVHHVLLVDDSFSMADRWNETSAWQEAKRAVHQILAQAKAKGGDQKVTLLRFSQAALVPVGQAGDAAECKLDAQTIDELNSLLEKLSVSETDAGPIEALQATRRMPESAAGESRVVYLISDFRSRQWSEDDRLPQLLSELRGQVSDLQLIQCVEETRPNLAISRLEPETGIRAAGVETWMLLGVTNYGDTPAVAVPVEIVQDGHKLPAVEFDEIPPGQEVTRRFRVAFADPGPHEVVAELPGDALKTDNTRYFAADIPNTFPLLLIDGSGQGDDSFYLQTALNPSGSGKPGWSPRVEPVSFLRNHDQLDDYAAIFLLDVPRLDAAEIQALEEYVRQGGGIAIFLGPESQRTFYNEKLYRDGTGLMPVTLDVPTQLLRSAEQATPDLEVRDHPVFRVFAGQRNSFLPLVNVQFYYALESPALDSTGSVRVLATLRNGAPLAIEKVFGSGKVFVYLCKLSQQKTSQGIWSNLCVNPVFPVVANELAGYLTSSQRARTDQRVGSELQFTLDETEYQPEVAVHPPGTATHSGIVLTPQSQDGRYLVDAGRGDLSGVWRFTLKPRQQASDTRLVAVNVDSPEGDLHRLEREELASRLEGVEFRFSLASQLSAAEDQLAGYRLGDTMLGLLVAALLGEQWLAYRASYHSDTGGGAS